MTDFDKAHVREIMDGHGDWFGARLLRLIGKADTHNREKLKRGFPEEVAAVEKACSLLTKTQAVQPEITNALSRSEQHEVFVKTLTGRKESHEKMD